MTLNDRLWPDIMSLEATVPAFAEPTAWLGEAKVTLASVDDMVEQTRPELSVEAAEAGVSLNRLATVKLAH